MKNIIVLLVSLFIPTTFIGGEDASGSVALTPEQVQTVTQLAVVYNIDSTEALSQFQRLLGSDYDEALAGEEFFENANAFEIAALALYNVENASVQAGLVNMLIKKEQFSSAVCNALLHVMDKANETIEEDDETRGGNEAVKAQIATAFSVWLGLTDPQVPFVTLDSRATYAEFSASAKERLASMGPGSPF